MADEMTAALEQIRADLGDGATYPRRVMEIHAPRLLAAVEAALKDHRKSMFPAGPPGAGNAYGKHYCAGICCTSIDDQVIYRVWPCQPYQDITAALSGTGKEGSEDG